MKRAEHNLFHAQGKTALLNAVSKDGPRGFILLQWKQTLSGSLAFKRNMYCSVSCLPVATVMTTGTHTQTHTCKHVYAWKSSSVWHSGLLFGIGGSEVVLACWWWAQDLACRRFKKKNSHTHTHTHTLKDNQSSVTFFKQSVAAECGLLARRSPVRYPTPTGKIWMVKVNEWHTFSKCNYHWCCLEQQLSPQLLSSQ